MRTKRRPGAGRKPLDPSGAKRPVTVWLSPADVAYCVAVGGTAPEGLRRLVAAGRGKFLKKPAAG